MYDSYILYLLCYYFLDDATVSHFQLMRRQHEVLANEVRVNTYVVLPIYKQCSAYDHIYTLMLSQLKSLDFHPKVNAYSSKLIDDSRYTRIMDRFQDIKVAT